MTSRARQARLLDEIWEVNRERLRRGDVEVDPILPTPETDDRRCLTLIAPVPEILQKALAAVVRPLPDTDRHYLYPPETFHITMRGIYDYGGYHRDEGSIAAMADVLSDICRHLPPCTVDLVGLNASRSAVYLQGLYDADTVPRLRAAMGAALARFHCAPLPTLDRPADFVWVNLLKYAHANVAALADAIDGLRGAVVGPWLLQRLDLAEMDKVNRPESRIIFARYVLGVGRVRGDAGPAAGRPTGAAR